jgi:hypothetical protein
VSRAAALLASVADRVVLAAPGNASAPAFEQIAAAGFRLERVGIQAEDYALVDRLAQDFPPAGLPDVLADADRQVKPIEGVLGGRARGYMWREADNRTRHWFPQGICGSADSSEDGLVHGRELHCVSWYSKRGEGARLSFVHAGPGAPSGYRHVLLVRPDAGGGFAPVRVHAGGIAWVGRFVYVADTWHGIRVFDTERILRVPDRHLEAARHYRYVLPQVGAYESTGDRLSFSFLSLDRSAPATLVAGEYRRSAGARIVQWPIDLAGGLLSAQQASSAYRSPVDRLQGATIVGGELLASSSRRGGRLYAGRPGERARRYVWWPFLPEDVYFSTRTAELYSVTEDPGRRMVFGVPLARLGITL